MSKAIKLEPLDSLNEISQSPISSRLSERSIDDKKENTLKNIGDCNFVINSYRNKINILHDSQLNYESAIENLYQKLESLNEDNLELKNKNQQLQDEIVNLKLDSILKLQKVQVRNEIKAKKNMENLDFLLKDMNCKTVSAITEKLYCDYEIAKKQLKQKYEEKISISRKKLEKELNRKENKHKELINQLKIYHSTQLKNLEKTFILILQQYAPGLNISETGSNKSIPNNNTSEVSPTFN